MVLRKVLDLTSFRFRMKLEGLGTRLHVELVKLVKS